MAQAIITIKIMPETADVDLNNIETEAKKIIKELGGNVGKVERVPIAFGLSSLNIIFVADEKLGTEEFEQRLGKLENIQTAQIIDFRRAIG